MLDRWVERAAPLLGRLAPAAVHAELAALSSEVAHLDAIVAGAGLDAVPAGTDDIAWLMRRSCALGLPAPQTLSLAGGSQRWETEDLAAFTQGVSLHQEPYAPTVKVVGRTRGQHTTRNVAVLTVGLMEALRIPEIDDPWMQHSDRLPFPVEWSARIYVRRPEEVTGELQRQMGKVRSQIRHYTHDHDLDPPMSLARQAERVLEVEDELTSGLTQLNTRLYGWWRIAVSGQDEAEALSRAQQVLELYRPKVQIEHPEAQYRFAREFIPGEPLASTAYRRRGSVIWAAAAVPAATASVGDRRGIMLGETCTATRRPVAWDPWLAQEVRRASGLTAVVGGLGSRQVVPHRADRLQDAAGRRALDGARPVRAAGRAHPAARAGPVLPAHQPAARRPGHPQPVPGGGRAAAGALRRRGRPGAGLAPGARAGRGHPAPAGARRAHRAAARSTSPGSRRPGSCCCARCARSAGRPTGTPAWSSTRCAGTPATARSTPAWSPTSWRSAASCRRPRCCSRTPPGTTRGTADRDYRLTVLTMQGMTLPRPGSPREEWTDGESLAVELLNLASWLTQRTIYEADRNLRKGVALDETHFLSQVPTGKVLIDRLARDSRKFNVRALFASQLAGDLLRVSGLRVAGQRGVRRPHRRRGGADRGAAAAAGAHRGRLRAAAGHAVPPAPARRPARRHAPAVRVRRRPRRRREDPHRPGGPAPGPPAGGAGHQPGRQPDVDHRAVPASRPPARSRRPPTRSPARSAAATRRPGRRRRRTSTRTSPTSTTRTACWPAGGRAADGDRVARPTARGPPARGPSCSTEPSCRTELELLDHERAGTPTSRSRPTSLEPRRRIATGTGRSAAAEARQARGGETVR